MPRIRLAEVLGSLSLATDMSTASPIEFGLRATVISTRLAERGGVPPDQLLTTYYACVTRMLGCTATATETASIAMGHDRLFNQAVLTCDWSEPDQVASRLRDVLPEGHAGAREDAIRGIIDQFEGIGEGASMHCAQAMMLSARLPVPAGVSDLLGFIWSRWDGKFPGAAGTDIPLPARVITVARGVELARSAGGRLAAEAVVADRSGTEFDPELGQVFLSSADEVLDGLDGPTAWDVFLDTEPGTPLTIGSDELTAIAETYADFADQKSGWFAGHSRRVSRLASDAAHAVGLDDRQQQAIRLAGLLHDVGVAGVHNGIWDKPGRLTPHERQLAESHSFHTAMVLRASSVFEDLAGIAGAAHERADGLGYHGGHRAIEPSMALLGAADVFDALVSERPWRPALTVDEAIDEVQGMCAAGELHAECAAAVLSVARGGTIVEAEYPAGLTGREVDVIKLLVTGMPTKSIARRLAISAKTADKHIQSVYDKTGARGRAPVALYALEHGLTAANRPGLRG